jgi:hypothetical protein
MKAARALGKSKGQNTVISAASLLLILLPIVLAFLYVGSYGVNILFGDGWTMVPLFEKYSQGTLGFQDLWRQHFEHRVFFVRVALLLIGIPTHADNYAAMYLHLACFVATTAVLLLAFRSSVSTRPLFFVPVPFLVFSLRQWSNFFHAFQLAAGLSLLFSVLAFYLLYLATRKDGRLGSFAGATASGVVASFSFSAGLFVWPVGFLQVLASPLSRRAKRVLALIWILATAATAVAYFYGLKVPEGQKAGYFYNNPSLGIDYFLTLLGNPLSPFRGAELLVGLLLVCLTGIALYLAYRAGRFGELSFWAALIAFSLLLMGIITLGRSGLGVAGALESRYVTFTSLVAVGTYAILVKLSLERGTAGRGARLVLVPLIAFAFLIALSLPFSYAYGIQMGRKMEADKRKELAAFDSYSTEPNQSLDIANRYSGYIRQNGFILCKLGYSAFSDPKVRASNCLPPPYSLLSPIESSTPSRILTVSGVKVKRQDQAVVVPEGRSFVRVIGRALTNRGKDPAGGVYLRLDGRLFPAFYGRNLGYVGNGVNTPVREFSGFEKDIPVWDLDPGEHELSIVVVARNRKGYYQPGSKIMLDVR